MLSQPQVEKVMMISLHRGMTLQFLHVIIFVFKQHEGHRCKLCTPRGELQPSLSSFKGAVVCLKMEGSFLLKQVLQNKRVFFF